SLQPSLATPHPPSFPTRRSSDLLLRGSSRGASSHSRQRPDTRPIPHPFRARPVPCGTIPANRPQDSEEKTSPASYDSASRIRARSEEHTSELQTRENLVCRLLLE